MAKSGIVALALAALASAALLVRHPLLRSAGRDAFELELSTLRRVRL